MENKRGNPNKTGMIHQLNQNYPRTMSLFTDWFIKQNTGMNMLQFQDTPIENRFLWFMKYFGQSIALPEEFTPGLLVGLIKEEFRESEALMVKYGNKTPDFMKEIAYMHYDKRKEFHDKLLAKTQPPRAHFSLCDALEPYTDIRPLPKYEAFNGGQENGQEQDNKENDPFVHAGDECPF